MSDSPLSSKLEIGEGLDKIQSAISPKYFYDTRGSALFEEITRLAEYYPTRIEQEIMATHAADIAANVGTGCTLIELGAGNCEKAKILCELIAPACYVAVLPMLRKSPTARPTIWFPAMASAAPYA